MERGGVLGGRYRLVKRLGRGGMGEVWAAHDDSLNRKIAIKILLANVDTEAKLIARLRHEARTAGALQHPGITVIHDIGDHDGHPYFVMELLDGRDCKVLVAEHPNGLPPGLALELMVQVADALAYAHDHGVVHRDIKPANLIQLTGGVKICDFGIARYAEATTHLTVTGGALGTPAFMAPEQWRGENVDARTDLYCFGATLHTLLTGRPPFPGPSQHALMHQHLVTPPPHLHDLRSDLPAGLDDLLQRLLAKDPTDRPATAHQVRHTLQTVFADLDAPAIATSARRGSTPTTRDRVNSSEPASTLRENGEPQRSAPHWPGRRTVLLGGLGAITAGVSAAAGIWPEHSRRGNATPRQSAATSGQDITLTGHTGNVDAVAFSPDGKILATGSNDTTVRLWDVAAARTTTTLTGHTGFVYSVAFSPDGKTLATGSTDGTARLWDVASARAASLTGHTDAVNSVAFNPDGKTLATGSWDGTVRLWDVATTRTTTTLTANTGFVVWVAFSPDGKTLAAGGGNNSVRLWDVATARTLAALTFPAVRGGYSAVQSVAFSPDGKTLAIGSSDKLARLRDTATGRIATLAGSAGVVNSVAFSPDGKTLATASSERTVRLWDVATARAAAASFADTGQAICVAFSPDGTTLAVGSNDRTARLWKVT
ncbi:hypothetical protein GCM10029978_107850 [Actinoallomurus acanthiterrae]